MANVEIWSDLHQSLANDNQGALKKSINVDAVKTSIDNILGTNQGERIFLPEFASRIRNMVFEPITNHLLNKLANEAREMIERWDDRVDILGVDINSQTDSNYVQITVRFNIKSYTEVFTHSVTVTR